MELLLKFSEQIFEGCPVHQLPLDLRPHRFVSGDRRLRHPRDRRLGQFLGLLVEKNQNSGSGRAIEVHSGFGYQIDFGRNFDYRYLLGCSLNHQCLREFNVLVCFDIGQSLSIPRSAGIQYVGPCVLQPRHSISLFPWLVILESSRLKSLQ
jgi:hypothetical protein